MMETDFAIGPEKASKNRSPPNRITNFKKGSLFYKLRLHFKSYCNHTSIHGFQYFGQDRTIFEKCFWMVMFVVTLICCSVAIYLIYDKWQKSPVIVSLTTRDTPIYSVPFPAVTICPTIKLSSDHVKYEEIIRKILSINDYYEEEEFEISESELKLLRYMVPICETSLKIGLQDYLAGNETAPEEIFEYFLKCSPFLNNTEDHMVSFMEDNLPFDTSLRPTLTEDGLCFTFNMLSTQEIYSESVHIHPGFKTDQPKSSWIPQEGYRKDAGLLTYPSRALMSGVLHSFDVKLLHSEKDISYLCTGALQGYKVTLHLPSRVPRSTLEFVIAPFGKSTMIAVHPQMMTTSDVIKSYSPDKRDCYFEGEKRLKFFRSYSKTNCLVECLTNYTLKECGCVSFYMPREASTPICGILNLSCVIAARRKYNLSKLKSKLDEHNKKVHKAPIPPKRINFTPKNVTRSRRAYDEEDLDDEDLRCDCLRPCNDITYSGTATTVDFNWRKLMAGIQSNRTDDGTDYTQIIVFLGTNTIFTTEKNELYGPTDFLSNFGGLLGLFTGFSMLSMMEILYFCSLRILGNVRIFGRWYGEDDRDN